MIPIRSYVNGLKFPEAPRWHDGSLWFSDMIGKRVCRADDEGQVTTVAIFDDMPGGLGFLPDGTPIVAGMHSATLFAISSGSPVSYCDISEAAAGHLDDMLVASDGTIYVGAVGVMSSGSVPSNGGIVRVTPSLDITRDVEGLSFPNGLATTGDGSRLLCNETFSGIISAFPILEAGRLGARSVWAETPGMHPDGLALDAEDGAWIGCFSEGKFIRVLAGGEVTDVLETPGRWATGVAIGGPDGRTLYTMSADTDVERFFNNDSSGMIGTSTVSVPAA